MTKWMVVASAIFNAALISTLDKTGIGWAIIIGMHVLLWYAHKIEVKLNRLLDHYGIVVTKQEIDNG